jgi:hypothetical protein
VTWFDTETESQFSCSGDTSEVSVFTALWDITDTATTLDFTPTQDDTPVDTLALADTEVWQVMTALPGSTFITAEDFWDKWFADADLERELRGDEVDLLDGGRDPLLPGPRSSRTSPRRRPSRWRRTASRSR